MAAENCKYVGKHIVKKDAKALLAGKPLYTDDIAPENALVVKLKRSPHAFAKIKEIDVSKAYKVPGIELILTYRDVPQTRFTLAGQSFPEPSPYDRLILDQYVRFEGEPVAIVAGIDESACLRALKLIQVEYEVYEPILDLHQALDHPNIIHPEDNYLCMDEFGADPKRNLCATGKHVVGDVDKVLADCDYVVDERYRIKAVNQAMMEPFTAFTSVDAYDRLVVHSSTQIPFHVRRILAQALEISKSQVRVIKPRIGGGFGAKQTAICEMYPAIVTYITKKPAHIIFTREECFMHGSPRHEMEVHVRLGADKEGHFKAIEIHTVSNTGAYGEHGPSTVGLTGTKPMSMYYGFDAHKFSFEVVYTNHLSAGAYRGYGATQGIFAMESAVNELAHKMNMDPSKLREMNMVHQGNKYTYYYGQTNTSCTLDRCVAKVKEMIDWDKKYPCYQVGPNKIRAVGMSMAMQSSGITDCDVGSAQLRLNDDGFYTMLVGCTDMGTGCDTILAQMAADCLSCNLDKIVVHGVDTDLSPYDSGSYASSTTYVTGTAVVKACEQMVDKILSSVSRIFGIEKESLGFDGECVYKTEDGSMVISLPDLVTRLQLGEGEVLTAQASYTSPVSPPPFMAGAAEIEVDLETGKITPIDYAGCVDCGTVINASLAKIQAEGGIVQGLGMALYEDIQYNEKGRLLNRNFMQYKIPTRMDVGQVQVAFEESYEPSGPFGAKSIGEIVINTPGAAIADAVYNATGLRFRTLPITAEAVFLGLQKK